MNKKYLWLAAALISVFALIVIACPSDPNTFTVTFDMNGKGSNTTATVDEGGKVSKPADPTDSDYDFTGWTSGGSEYNFNTPVTKDITILAQWKLKDDFDGETVTVTFDVAGGSEIDSIKIKYGDTVIRPADPTKESSIFKNWYSSTDFIDENIYDFTTPVSEDIILYAFWDALMVEEGGFNWMVIDDTKETDNGKPGGTPIGNSTINFIDKADIDGMKVFAVSGTVRYGFQYGFALLSAQATDENLAALRSAKKIRFWISAPTTISLDVKLPQENKKGPMEGGDGDSGYYYHNLSANSTAKQVTLTIPTTGTNGAGSNFTEPSWCVKKSYDQTTLQQINFQTTFSGSGAQAHNFEFQVWGLELLSE